LSRVRFSIAAKKDLIDIFLYVADDNIQAASGLLTTMYQKC